MYTSYINIYYNIWTHYAFTYDESATTNSESVKIYINDKVDTRIRIGKVS